MSSTEHGPDIVDGNHDDTPVFMSANSFRVAAASVLLVEILERIAFYGIVGNLVLFLNTDPFNWLSYNAASALFLFSALTYFFSLFGGWLADSYLGRFNCIVIFLLVYILGYAVFPLLGYAHNFSSLWWCKDKGNLSYTPHTNSMFAHDGNYTFYEASTFLKRHYSQENCSIIIYSSLLVVAVGCSAFKVNIAPLGADQVVNEGTETIQSFFNWFYWAVNFGALISLGTVCYIQQQYSFFIGYLVPAACLLLALFILLSSRCYLTRRIASGSVLSSIIGICWCAIRSSILSARPSASAVSFLDKAKLRHGGNYHEEAVEDLKKMMRVLLYFLLLIPYWVVYFQMQTTFLLQSLHMRLDINTSNTDSHHPFMITVAWLSLFDVVVLILLIPILEHGIYPGLASIGICLSRTMRMVLGQVLAFLSMASAAIIEMWRLNIYWKDGFSHEIPQKIGNTTFKAADLSVFWQLPQYALVGGSEVFTSVAGLELAYIESPRCFQSLVMGLFWFTQGLGCTLGLLLLKVFQGLWLFSWDRGDINCNHPHQCHLDYYFWFLAAFQVAGLILFVVVSSLRPLPFGFSEYRSLDYRDCYVDDNYDNDEVAGIDNDDAHT